ncbi:hypothetical protein P7K49_019080, partial [Saguinus oedipus]
SGIEKKEGQDIREEDLMSAQRLRQISLEVLWSLWPGQLHRAGEHKPWGNLCLQMEPGCFGEGRGQVVDVRLEGWAVCTAHNVEVLEPWQLGRVDRDGPCGVEDVKGQDLAPSPTSARLTRESR